jgi:hypothetical protein
MSIECIGRDGLILVARRLSASPAELSILEPAPGGHNWRLRHRCQRLNQPRRVDSIPLIGDLGRLPAAPDVELHLS